MGVQSRMGQQEIPALLCAGAAGPRGGEAVVCTEQADFCHTAVPPCHALGPVHFQKPPSSLRPVTNDRRSSLCPTSALPALL